MFRKHVMKAEMMLVLIQNCMLTLYQNTIITNYRFKQYTNTLCLDIKMIHSMLKK